MPRHIRWDELTLENVLSLVEALLQLSEQQDCESKLPLCVVWEADKLRITGYKSEQTRGNRTKTTEVGTKLEYLLNQIKDAGKTVKLPQLKAESNVSHKDRESDQVQAALDCLKELGVREDQPAKKNQGYWKFLLTLKHQTATREENLEVVKQKWKQHPKTNSSTGSQIQTADKSFDWQEICRTMLEKHKRLTTNQLLFADDEMKFELEEIHVPLALLERSKPKKCSEDISAEQGSRLYEPSYEEKQRFEHEAFLGQIIRDGVGKTQGQRIALIGEPGAGKTTQLQTIAFWILDNNLGLPIWISLADLQEKSVKDYLLQYWLEDATEEMHVTLEQQKNFAELFKNKNVWLLLDAADEMSSLQPLTEISQQLTGWVKNARVVLTCRVNVWEANAGALENFETYRLLNFEYPQQVQEFIQRWFHKKDADEGKRLWNELDKPERQRIQDLVKNPLRLALLCSTWQGSDKGLPETKAGLYQQFVEEFYKWKEKSFPITEEKQEELNAALGRLAKRAIDQETSRFRLRHKLVREELGDAKQPNSLFWLALQLGWLNEVGIAAESATKEKVYAFYHPTFEEYFAALAVDDWDEFLNHVPDNPALGVYRIFAPQWKEVILLWLGCEDVGKKEKEEFIQALVEFDDGCGEFYKYRAYFLAAAAIGEFENSIYADEIVEQLIKWKFNGARERTPIATEAEVALLQTHHQKVVDALAIKLESSRSSLASLDIAIALIQKSPGNSIAVTVIVDFLERNKDFIIRAKALTNLKKFGAINPIAMAYLDKKLPNRENNKQSLLSNSYRSWFKLPTGDPNDLEGLLELMAKINMEMFYQAIKRLNDINILVGLLGKRLILETNIEGLENIKTLIEVLETLDHSNSPFVNNLIFCIHNSVRDRLIEIASSRDINVSKLLEIMYKPNQSKHIFEQITWVLGEAASKSSEATKAIIHLLLSIDDCLFANDFIFPFLNEIINSDILEIVVKSLKDYIEEIKVYEVLWHCAQNMPYPAFYQAWHQQEKVKDGE